MKIAILLGSVRKGRNSHLIAYYLEKKLKQRGIDTDLIDLAKESLPVLEERVGHDPQLPEKVQEISTRLNNGDALIFVTPEYHGSFSGALKNALDYFWSEFSKKPIGVVAVSSGKMGGINASTQLQHVVLSLGAYALPLKLLVPEIHDAFNELNEPKQERLAKSAQRFLDEFLWFSEAIVKAKQSKEENVMK